MKPKLFFKRNSSTILTVLGCAGVVATAVLSAKAAPKAKRLLANAELEKGEELTRENRDSGSYIFACDIDRFGDYILHLRSTNS